MSIQKERLNNLTGLRFLAASYVIAFHFFDFPGNEVARSFISAGRISVSFFFLLSGFVLGHCYSDYDFKGKLKKYLIARIIRITPIYYIGLFLAIPIVLRRMLHAPVETENWTQIVSYTVLHLTYLQGLIPTKGVMFFWNVHSWSLCVEFFLYLISPVFIYKIAKMKIKKSFFWLFVLLALNTAIYFIPLDIENENAASSTIYWEFWPFLFLPIFATGMILAKIYSQYKIEIERYAIWGFPLSFIFLLVSFFMFLDKSFYSSFNPFYQVLFSLLILFSCTPNTFNNFLGTRAMVLLGDASFAMYMLQAPIKTYTQQFLYKVVGYEMSNGIIFCGLIFISITLFSLFISMKIDPYIRKILHKKLL